MLVYKPMSLVESITRYGRWSFSTNRWWVVFLNQLKLLPFKTPIQIGLKNGLQFWVRPNTRDINEVLSVGLGNEYGGVPEHLPQPDVLFDMGAHIGVFSVWSRSRYPNCTVIALEPEPNNFQLLEKNIHLNELQNQTACLPSAVHIRTEKVTFHISSLNNAHSMVVNSTSENTTSVDAVSFRSLYEKYVGPQKTFAIKMDIEGSEYDLLEHHRDIIAQTQFIVMEWHSFTNTDRPEKWNWLTTYFNELGFITHPLSNRTAIWYRH